MHSGTSGEKVVKSREWDQPYSEQQCSAKSSTLLLAFPGRGGAAPKQKEEGRTEQGGEKNTQYRFLTSLGLISSPSSPHFVLHGGVFKAVLPFWCEFLKTSLFWKLLPFWVVLGTAGGNVQQRHRGRVGLCDWTARQPSRVKWKLQAVFSGLWLPSTKQTQLICSPRVKKSHTLSLLHTGTLLCMSLTVLDWVCLLHSNTIDSSSSLLPLHKALVRGGN